MFYADSRDTMEPSEIPNGPVASAAKLAEQRRPRDVMIGVLLATMYVGHVAWILIFASPLSWFCCTCPPLDTYVWILAALLCTGFLLWHTPGKQKRAKVQRLVLAGLLVIFVGDVLSGGNYRWLNLALQRELNNCGGADALDRWADQYLSAPDVMSGARGIDSNDAHLPDNVRRLAKHFGPIFISRETTPDAWINFGSEGPEQGWGIAAGHPTLEPAEFGPVINRGWLKQVRPGVFFYAWGFGI